MQSIIHFDNCELAGKIAESQEASATEGKTHLLLIQKPIWSYTYIA